MAIAAHSDTGGPERRARIKACMHENSRGAGMGYALCDDCGALLPDEDPDLEAKCSMPDNSN